MASVLCLGCLCCYFMYTRTWHLGPSPSPSSLYLLSHCRPYTPPFDSYVRFFRFFLVSCSFIRSFVGLVFLAFLVRLCSVGLLSSWSLEGTITATDVGTQYQGSWVLRPPPPSKSRHLTQRLPYLLPVRFLNLNVVKRVQ